MSTAENTMAGGLLQQKRRWIKYYCEECQAWETREMFEVVKFDRGPPLSSSSSPSSSPAGLGSPSCAVWSWGCAKLIRHGTVQSFRVEHLNNADGHDLAAPDKLDFPTSSPSSAPKQQQQQLQQQQQQQPEGQADQAVVEEVSALQQQSVQHPAQSNGSSQQSKRPKRTVRSAYARESPINSQGGVTSSSPADEVVPDENGASTLHHSFKDEHAAVAAAADTTGPESPAVIDAEHHENGVYKRPRRLTAGDRGLAQALQFEKVKKVPTTPKAVADEKPSPPSLAAAMKRPKRVTAGLKGMALAAENAKLAPRSLVKKEPKKDAVHQVNVQTRSSTAKKPMKKNKKVGDLY